MRRLGPVVAALLAALAMGASADAAVMIGNASTVVREVKSSFETRERVLIVDDDVFQDEEVTTGALSAARLIFKDGTNMSIGAQSRLKLTRVLFDPDPSKSKVAMRAAIGVFRMATGSLPSSAYQVATPVATISVRGTIIEFTVTGTGTTTVYVAKGAATVRSNNGDEVDLEAGQSTTVRAEGSDGGDILAMSPTPPETPDEDFAKQLRSMTVNIRSEEPQLDMLPGGGGYNYNRGQNFPAFNPPPRASYPSYQGNPPPAAGGGAGGGSTGGGGTTSNTPGGTGNNGGSPGGNPGGGTPSLKIQADGPTYARAGTATETTIIISRLDEGTTAAIGTLDALSGAYSGPGSGTDGIALSGKSQASYVYGFNAPSLQNGQPATYTANLGYSFAGIVSGTLQLSTTVVGPVMRIEGANGGSITPHSLGANPFSYGIRLVNDGLSGMELELVGLSIGTLSLSGSGSALFDVSFADTDGDGVLAGGESGLISLLYQGGGAGETLDGTLPSSLLTLLATDGPLTLTICTDIDRAFGVADNCFAYQIVFPDGMIIVEPETGIVVLAAGTVLLAIRRRRTRR